MITHGSKALVKGTDYTLSYRNNTNTGTATVTITGIGNYTGSRDVTFTIKRVSIGSAYTPPTPDQEYTGYPVTPDPVLTFNGKTLVKGVDYTVSYSNNIERGYYAMVRVTGMGNFAGSSWVWWFTIR